MWKDDHTSSKSHILHIKGLVQGVGFRPFIYRLANELDLRGWVENRNDGVFIKTSCSNAKIKLFEEQIKKQAPPASQIHSITIKEASAEYFNSFKILKSSNTSTKITQVSPDIGVCSECLLDIENQFHRKQYSFTNCTNCGPRFSIIKQLPYDRPNTTMERFALCDICKKEYENVLDRRFHAQPIACNNCGPVYKLTQSNTTISEIKLIIQEISKGIALGKVYAIKGIGGFHLMCDAENEVAVNRIRTIKYRDGKPFAIMTLLLKNLKVIAEISAEEKELLSSWQRPIVLLKYKNGLAKGVSNGLNKVGVMLPYMPLHYQLFKKLKTQFIVLTSGNISDEPIVIDNNKATVIFKDKVDGIINYNRDIYNRVDDSVCTVINRNTRVIRRSRGFAPRPIVTDFNTEGIFAAGAELANSFCIGKGEQALMSQYLGDLKNLETLEFYEETYKRFEKLFQFKPQLIAADLHSNYLSSQFAQKLSEKHQIPFVKIQHHHAHIASVMASNKLNNKIIGVSFDGIGLGTDGNIWGAEFMMADLCDFERLYHFEYIHMPGGDKASKEPWRMAIAYLYKVYGDDLFNLKLPLFKSIGKTKVLNTIQMLKNNINSPLASSAGRLFDAVASLIDIRHFNTFQAEGPMRLESLIIKSEKGSYNYKVENGILSFSFMIKQIIEDYNQGQSQAVISTKFHNTIIKLVVNTVKSIAEQKDLNMVILSGGTFQNAYLTESIENKLITQGFKVYYSNEIPVNDQGIALGQIAIAAMHRKLGLI